MQATCFHCFNCNLSFNVHKKIKTYVLLQCDMIQSYRTDEEECKQQELGVETTVEVHVGCGDMLVEDARQSRKVHVVISR